MLLKVENDTISSSIDEFFIRPNFDFSSANNCIFQAIIVAGLTKLDIRNLSSKNYTYKVEFSQIAATSLPQN